MDLTSDDQALRPVPAAALVLLYSSQEVGCSQSNQFPTHISNTFKMGLIDKLQASTYPRVQAPPNQHPCIHAYPYPPPPSQRARQESNSSVIQNSSSTVWSSVTPAASTAARSPPAHNTLTENTSTTPTPVPIHPPAQSRSNRLEAGVHLGEMGLRNRGGGPDFMNDI